MIKLIIMLATVFNYSGNFTLALDKMRVEDIKNVKLVILIVSQSRLHIPTGDAVLFGTSASADGALHHVKGLFYGCLPREFLAHIGLQSHRSVLLGLDRYAPPTQSPDCAVPLALLLCCLHGTETRQAGRGWSQQCVCLKWTM